MTGFYIIQIGLVLVSLFGFTYKENHPKKPAS